jgi:hypothetical protein
MKPLLIFLLPPIISIPSCNLPSFEQIFGDGKEPEPVIEACSAETMTRTADYIRALKEEYRRSLESKKPIRNPTNFNIAQILPNGNISGDVIIDPNKLDELRFDPNNLTRVIVTTTPLGHDMKKVLGVRSVVCQVNQ